jgi:hypothetical protein
VLPTGKAAVRLNIDASRYGNAARFFNHRCAAAACVTQQPATAPAACTGQQCAIARSTRSPPVQSSAGLGPALQRSTWLQCSTPAAALPKLTLQLPLPLTCQHLRPNSLPAWSSCPLHLAGSPCNIHMLYCTLVLHGAVHVIRSSELHPSLPLPAPQLRWWQPLTDAGQAVRGDAALRGAVCLPGYPPWPGADLLLRQQPCWGAAAGGAAGVAARAAAGTA